MKTAVSELILITSIVFSATVFVTSENTRHDEFLGLWKTIDDETNKPRSVVKLYLVDGKLNGKIVQTFPQPGEIADPVCEACKDELHNQKIIGMRIITGMEFKKGKWRGGEIPDPDNGKFYDCKIWIEEQKLKIRGYIGFFYRTQEWHKYEAK